MKDIILDTLVDSIKMLPFLFLSYPSPIGPVYAVAGLSVLTVFLLFQITKKVFDRQTAILASIFFTFSASVVNLARFSWNPNPAPFFSLLMFYFTYLYYNVNQLLDLNYKDALFVYF